LHRSLMMKKLQHLCKPILFIWFFGLSGIATADVKDIPFNPSFPNAKYPYAQAPDGCSGWSDPREVRDNWGPVSFTEACNNHDRCYYTLGSNWNSCNSRYLTNLNSACYSDLRIAVNRPDPTIRDPLRTKKVYLPPDPVRLSACYSLALTYYSGVQTGVLLNVFKEAQDKQRRYEDWASGYILSTLTSGYYRRNDRPEVYYVNAGTRTACHIQNPSQMDVYGGFKRVLIVQDDRFRTGANFTGPCPWPDGLYRSRERPEVYLLHNNWQSACWVRTPERVEQLGGWGNVRLVDGTSRESLSVGRNYLEAC
jgi:hypothetical protein